MKKFLTLLLLPVFLLTTSGVAITTLYCQGKISGIGMGVKACCKDVNKGGCCSSHTTIVKIDDGFIHDLNHLKTDAMIDILFLPLFTYFHLPIIPDTFLTFYWDESPPLPKEALYILFLRLII